MYPDLDEILALSTSESLLTREREVQESIYTMAIAAIERHCGQVFTSEGDGSEGPVTRTFDGNGSRILYLDRRLSSLDSLAMNGNAIDADNFTVSPRHNRISWATTNFGSWASRVVAEMEFGARLSFFDPGLDNIAITGVWGWTDAEFPVLLTDAILLCVEDYAAIEANALTETIAVARMQGVGSISQGDLSIDLTNRELDLSRRVKRVLASKTGGEPLVFPSGSGAVVP